MLAFKSVFPLRNLCGGQRELFQNYFLEIKTDDDIWEHRETYKLAFHD